MRGKLLCSGVGIKNSYKHRVQSADIDIIFGPMLKNWEVYDVNGGNAQAMTQSFRYWNILLGGDRQVLHAILWYVMVVNVLFVLNMYLQNRVFQMILHIVLLLLKIKSNYIYKKKKNSVWLSNIINKDFGCRWIWNYNDPRWNLSIDLSCDHQIHVTLLFWRPPDNPSIGRQITLLLWRLPDNSSLLAAAR